VQNSGNNNLKSDLRNNISEKNGNLPQYFVLREVNLQNDSMFILEDCRCGQRMLAVDLNKKLLKMYSWCGYNNDSIHPDFGEWIIDSVVSNKAITKIFSTQNGEKYTSDSCIVMNINLSTQVTKLESCNKENNALFIYNREVKRYPKIEENCGDYDG